MPSEDGVVIVNAIQRLRESLERASTQASRQASNDFGDVANELVQVIQKTAGETHNRLDAVRQGLFAVQSGIELLRELKG